MRYNDKISHYFHQSTHVGSFADDDSVVVGKAGAENLGDCVQLQLKLKKEKVVDAKFKAYGSVVTIASMAYLAEWVADKPVKEIQNFCHEEIVKALSLPSMKIHSAILAADALVDALDKL